MKGTKDFWNKQKSRAEIELETTTADHPATTAKASKVERNKKAKVPSKGGAKLKTTMKNDSRGVPSAAENTGLNMTFNPGDVKLHTRKVSGSKKNNAALEAKGKGDSGYKEAFAVASTHSAKFSQRLRNSIGFIGGYEV